MLCVACWLLLVVCGLCSGVCNVSLFMVCCFNKELVAVCCLTFVDCCLAFVECCLLSVDCSLLCVGGVCRLLSVVWCVLFDVRCLLFAGC